MSVYVQTYLLTEQSYIELYAFSGRIRDPRYIEGSIVLEIHGRRVLDRNDLDLVDQLWVYLVDAIAAFSEAGRADFHFPDQPARVELDKQPGDRALVRVTRGNTTTSAIVRRAELVDAVLAAADRALARFGELAPSNRNAYERARSIARAVRRQAAGSRR